MRHVGCSFCHAHILEMEGIANQLAKAHAAKAKARQGGDEEEEAVTVIAVSLGTRQQALELKVGERALVVGGRLV